MNNTDDKATKSGTAENDVAKPGLWLAPDGIQPLHRAEPNPDPATTAQEAAREDMTPKAARDVARVAGAIPLKAARGDDDLMSKPPVVSPHSAKS